MIELNRGSGRSTAMLLEAKGCDNSVVVIVAPTVHIRDHLIHLFYEIIQGEEQYQYTKRKTAFINTRRKQTFHFRVLQHREEIDRLRGIRDLEVFWDHTMTERRFALSGGLRLLGELISLRNYVRGRR